MQGQIPPILPLQKGGISPLWPPAHRASGPEGKEGLGEIFAAICLFNYGLLSRFIILDLEEEGIKNPPWILHFSKGDFLSPKMENYRIVPT